jgi:hypothetical protein
MAPILGIYASSITPSLQNSYESLQTVTVGSGGASSISFTSIPSGYQHLQVRYIGALNSGSQGHTINFNSDTGSNYAFHSLQGTGSAAVASYNGTSVTTASIGYVAPNTAPAGSMGAGVIDVLDYLNSNKYKTVRALTGTDQNGSGLTGIYSGLWMSTSAITSLTLTPQSGSSYIQYSTFALYGVKG